MASVCNRRDFSFLYSPPLPPFTGGGIFFVCRCLFFDNGYANFYKNFEHRCPSFVLFMRTLVGVGADLCALKCFLPEI